MRTTAAAQVDSRYAAGSSRTSSGATSELAIRGPGPGMPPQRRARSANLQLGRDDGCPAAGRTERTKAKVPVRSARVDVAARARSGLPPWRGESARAGAAGRRSRGALVVAAPVDDIDRTLHRAALILLLVIARRPRSRRRRRSARLERGARPGATTHGDRRAHRRDRRAERARTGERARRARAARRAFNTMLGALEESLETQRSFVADASHELRTPLTSMQTNIEVLVRRIRPLDPEARERLFADLQREAHEMRDLIAGLLELARGDDPRLERGARASRRAGRERRPPGTLALPAVSPGRRELEPTIVERLPGAPRARGLEPPRERGQVEPRGLVRRRHRCTGRAHRPRLRPRHRGRRPSARLRPLLPRRRTPARSPAPASGSRSCARSPRRKAARSPPTKRRVAARCSGCG